LEGKKKKDFKLVVKTRSQIFTGEGKGTPGRNEQKQKRWPERGGGGPVRERVRFAANPLKTVQLGEWGKTWTIRGDISQKVLLADPVI